MRVIFASTIFADLTASESGVTYFQRVGNSINTSSPLVWGEPYRADAGIPPFETIELFAWPAVHYDRNLNNKPLQ